MSLHCDIADSLINEEQSLETFDNHRCAICHDEKLNVL